MAVIGPLSVCLEVPRLEDGVKFYTDAGLRLSDAGAQSESVARLRCPEQERDCVVLLGGAAASVFLTSLIASGVSISVVGTMAGQMVLQASSTSASR